MPKGKLLGRVVLTCPRKEEILDLPGGTPVVELLTRAAALFGCGHFTDRNYHVASKYSDLAGGFYTWSAGKWLLAQASIDTMAAVQYYVESLLP